MKLEQGNPYQAPCQPAGSAVKNGSRGSLLARTYYGVVTFVLFMLGICLVLGGVGAVVDVLITALIEHYLGQRLPAYEGLVNFKGMTDVGSKLCDSALLSASGIALLIIWRRIDKRLPPGFFRETTIRRKTSLTSS